jgi:hypothetical protein
MGGGRLNRVTPGENLQGGYELPNPPIGLHAIGPQPCMLKTGLAWLSWLSRVPGLKLAGLTTGAGPHSGQAPRCGSQKAQSVSFAG